MELTGTVALITGAGSGIGRASALSFAGAGCAAVVIGDVDVAAGEATAALVERAGARAAFLPVDVSDQASLTAFFEAAETRFGGLDVVHNNAGLVSGNPPWPDTPIERIHQLVNVNVFGTFAGTRLAIDALRRRGGGAIVNTASVAGLAPMATDAVYAATKAAVILFTQSCAEVAKSDGIRVNAVLPGIVDTSMVAKTGDGERPADWLTPMLGMLHLLDPRTVAEAVIGLIRDDARAGETVIVANEFRSPEELAQRPPPVTEQ